MAVKIGSARIDERGKAHGGKAGDNNGKEVSTQNWYLHSKGWRVLRAKAPSVAEKIAYCMEAACANDRIGYDQYQRLTLYNEAKAVGFNCAKVEKKCETDCSALVRVCMAYAGIDVPNFRTTDQARIMLGSGAFYELTGSRYTKQDEYLRRGDVLVTKSQGHTVVVLSDGPKLDYALGDRDLGQGMTGPDVFELQEALLSLGYRLPQYGSDGDYGEETKAAVEEFQQDYRLDVDGVAGRETIAALLTACAGEPEEPDEPDEPDEPNEPDEPADTVGETAVYPVRGVIPDVSKYQKNIDWEKMATAVDFAIIRVQDNTILDSKLSQNIAGAKGNQVPYGLYAYFRAASEDDAIREADLFYDRAMDAGAYEPIIWYIDVEKKTASWPKQRAAVLAYANRLRERGAERVGLYTYNAMYPNLKALAQYMDDIWLAHYGRNVGYPTGYPTAPCGLHQYTSMAGAKGYEQYAVRGIQGRVDLNRLTGQKPLSWYTGRTYDEDKGQVTVTGNTVWVRSGPGTDWTSLGVVRRGTLLTRTGDDYDGWIGVTYQGQAAHISAKYVKEA